MAPSDDPSPKPGRPEGRVRDHLANERTFLAWVRTALGLIGIGFVLARMGVFLRQLAMMSGSGPHREFRGSHEFLFTGIVFLILGTALCVAANRLYNRARKAIDANQYEPPRHAVLILTVVVVAGSLVITALVLRQLVALGEK
jgi:putative membrane protein